MRFRVAVKREAKNARSSRSNKFRKTKQNARLKILLISSRAFSSYIKFGGFGRINFFIFSLPFGRFLMCQYSKTRRYLFSTTVFACSRRLIGGFIFALSNWNWSAYLLSAELAFDFDLSTKPVSREDTNATVACVANIPYSSLP